MNNGRMNIIQLSAMAVFLFLLCVSCSALAAEEYVLDIPVPEGLSAGSLSKMFKDVAATVSKRLNVKLSVNEIKYTRGMDEEVFNIMLKNLKSGKTHMSLIESPIQYAKFSAQAKDYMTPFLSLTLNHKSKLDLCAYVRKDANYGGILDLKGKVWGGSMSASTRYLLSTKGVNTPMKSFFSKIKFVNETNVTTPFEELLNKKIDVFVTPSYLFEMAKGGNPKFAAELRQMDCTEFEHVWFFSYNKKGIPQDIVDKIKNIMVNSHKDKDFAQYKFMLAALKGQFVAFDNNMSVTDKLGALYKKNGWEKEQTDFIKANTK